jgi:hypothetical protein
VRAPARRPWAHAHLVDQAAGGSGGVLEVGARVLRVQQLLPQHILRQPRRGAGERFAGGACSAPAAGGVCVWCVVAMRMQKAAFVAAGVVVVAAAAVVVVAVVVAYLWYYCRWCSCRSW